MSVIVMPSGLMVAQFSLGQADYGISEPSDATGASADRYFGPPRWTLSMASPDALDLTQGAVWEAMLLRLRGRVNHLQAWDITRAQPQGTLRGAPTVSSGVSAGATYVALGYVRTALNLLTHSRAFDAAAWTAINGCSVTANTTVGPTGSLTADTLTDSNAANTSAMRQDVAVADDAATYTYSVYLAKTAGGTSPSALLKFQLLGGTTVQAFAYVDTDAGAILSGAGTVVSAGANWWRVSVTAANNATGNTQARTEVFPAAAPHGSGTPDVTTTGSCIAWGAQLELGSAATAMGYATVLAGDWLQIGTGLGTSQLVKCVANATENSAGTMAVTFEPPLRSGFSAGTPVAWDRPSAYFKRSTGRTAWRGVPGAVLLGGYQVDLIERWN